MREKLEKAIAMIDGLDDSAEKLYALWLARKTLADVENGAAEKVKSISITVDAVLAAAAKLHREKYREIRCPNCLGRRIFEFQLDSDWAAGTGRYAMLNNEESYEEADHHLTALDRPDIEIKHCLDCQNQFI